MTVLNTIKKLLKIVVAFLILISLGLSFDLYDRFNKYGWIYEETKIINDISVITRINLMNSIYFCLIFWIINFMALYSLILLEKLS